MLGTTKNKVITSAKESIRLNTKELHNKRNSMGRLKFNLIAGERYDVRWKDRWTTLKGWVIGGLAMLCWHKNAHGLDQKGWLKEVWIYWMKYFFACVSHYTYRMGMRFRLTLRSGDHHTIRKGGGIAHTAEVRAVRVQHFRRTETVVNLTRTLVRWKVVKVWVTKRYGWRCDCVSQDGRGAIYARSSSRYYPGMRTNSNQGICRKAYYCKHV